MYFVAIASCLLLLLSSQQMVRGAFADSFLTTTVKATATTATRKFDGQYNNNVKTKKTPISLSSTDDVVNHVVLQAATKTTKTTATKSLFQRHRPSYSTTSSCTKVLGRTVPTRLSSHGRTRPAILSSLSASTTSSIRGGGGGGVDGNTPPPPPPTTTTIQPTTIQTKLPKLPDILPSVPTLKEYRNFALPCLALWVAGPLLSLVDTTFVGLSGDAGQSAQQLAALGPATTFFDGATYLFAFLNVATTNLYSSARAQTGDKSDKAEAVVRTSARVAIRCGFGIMLFLFLFSRPLLKLYIGPQAIATSGSLLDSACDYIYIRALSMPTSLLLGVLQASLLGAKDSVTPLVAIVYSTIVNFVGDYLLVSVFPYGLRGAAIATTLAQWAGTAALIPAARRRLVRNGNLGFYTKGPQNEDSVSSRTFLSFAAPVLTLIMGKLAAFGFMTHSAAAVPGQPTPLASHQIILSLLFFCSPFFEVISQTAQTFLPAFIAPVKEYAKKMITKDSTYDINHDVKVEPWLQSSRKVATDLLTIGLASAGCVASIASLVPAYFGYCITSNTVVQEAVKPLAKYLWFGAFMWAPVAVSEGILLARLELKFLASIYLLSTALLPPALMKIKYNPTGTVGQVWSCFVVFQSFRAAAFMTRIWGGYARERILRITTKNGIIHRLIGGSQTKEQVKELPIVQVQDTTTTTTFSGSTLLMMDNNTSIVSTVDQVDSDSALPAATPSIEDSQSD